MSEAFAQGPYTASTALSDAQTQVTKQELRTIDRCVPTTTLALRFIGHGVHWLRGSLALGCSTTASDTIQHSKCPGVLISIPV